MTPRRPLVLATLCLALASWGFAPPEPPAEPDSVSSSAGEVPKWRFPDGVKVSPDDRVEPPVLVLRVKPVYVRPVATEKRHGRIGLELELNEQGGITRATVTRSLEPGLDSDAVAAAMKWKYTPARLNGVARPCLARAILFYSPPPADGPSQEEIAEGAVTWVNDKFGFLGRVEIGPDDEVKRPEILQPQLRPLYSESARKKKISGAVVLEIRIDAEGRVSDPKILRSLEPSLDDNTVNAVLQWRFAPARLNGVARPCVYRLTTSFQVQ